MKRTQIYITEKQQKSLKKLSAALGIGVSEVIRRMLDKGIKCEIKNLRKNEST